MKKKILFISCLIILLTSIVITGCSKESEKTGSKTDSENDLDLSDVTLRFGTTGWDLQQALLEAAGYDDTEYKVEYTTFQGGNLCLEAMAAGQLDLTGSSEIPPIFASLAENKGNFKIIAINSDNTQNQELIIPKGSDIKKVADLKGKRVGYVKSTTAQYFLYKMLEEAGLSWDDIERVEISTADGVTALLGGDLDAFASYGNSINAAKAKGATTLAYADTILSGNFPYEASLDALKDEKKKAAIVDYLSRLEKAYQWKNENPEKWAEISADPSGLTYEDNLDLIKRGIEQKPTHIITISDDIISSEQNVADVFYTLGLLEEKVDVSSLYDDSLSDAINEALEAAK